MLIAQRNEIAFSVEESVFNVQTTIYRVLGPTANTEPYDARRWQPAADIEC